METHWKVVHDDPDIASKVYLADDPQIAAKKALRDFKAMERVTVRNRDTEEEYTFNIGDLSKGMDKRTNKGHSHRQ